MEIGRVLRPNCKECGKRFATTSRVVRYCSDRCRAEGRRHSRREYMRMYRADPQKLAMVLARGRAAAAAKAASKRGGRPPQPRPPMRVDPNAAPSTCRLCGRTFEQYGRGGHAYCKGCTAKADREIAATQHIKCRACGKAFTTASRVVRYCSKACSAEGVLRTQRTSQRKIKADPEKRAIVAARKRVQNAARRARKSGG